MTNANILKKFFKKYYNSDTSGNSTISVMQDFMDKNETLPGGGSDVMIVHIIQKEQIHDSDSPQEKADKLEFDATFDEIDAAVEANKTILVAQDSCYIGPGSSPLIELDCYIDEDTGDKYYTSRHYGFYAETNSLYAVQVIVCLFAESGSTPIYTNEWYEQYCSVTWNDVE